MNLVKPLCRMTVLFLLVLLVACGGSNNASTNSMSMGGAVQGKALSLSKEVSTIAGSTVVDGTGTEARFYEPLGITKTGNNLYVVDRLGRTVRKVDVATGAVTTVAASYSGLYGIATDGQGLYVTEPFRNVILKIDIATGMVSTFAGSGNSGSVDGIGAQASFAYPTGITTDGTNLYVSDTGTARIRKIVIATREVTTLAGSERSYPGVDGVGAAATFSYPEAITTDGTNVYVSDGTGLRKIVIATGAVTSFAQAQYFTSLTTDGAYIYGGRAYDNCIERIQIDGSGLERYAGSSGAQSAGAVDGPVTAARFYQPRGIVADGTNLYVSDTKNHTIRRIDLATDIVSTLAGSANADGVGSAARLYAPGGIATDGASLYVAERYQGTIRRVSLATGAVTTLPVMSGVVMDITTDGSNLYLAYSSWIAKVAIATGEVTAVAGSRTELNASVDGIGTAARFSYITGITTDGSSLYVTDNHAVRKIDLRSTLVATIAGTAGTAGSADGSGSTATFSSLAGITTDGANLYVVDDGKVRKIDKSTMVVTTLTGAGTIIIGATGITSDGSSLYVTAFGTVQKVDAATGAVTPIAGALGGDGASDGIGTAARFTQPYGITTDGKCLYVADSGNGLIRRIR